MEEITDRGSELNSREASHRFRATNTSSTTSSTTNLGWCSESAHGAAFVASALGMPSSMGLFSPFRTMFSSMQREIGSLKTKAYPPTGLS